MSNEDEYFAARALEYEEDDDDISIVAGKRGGGRKGLPNLPPIPPANASEAVKEKMLAERRSQYFKERAKNLRDGDHNPNLTINGNHSATLRPMS